MTLRTGRCSERLAANATAGAVGLTELGCGPMLSGSRSVVSDPPAPAQSSMPAARTGSIVLALLF